MNEKEKIEKIYKNKFNTDMLCGNGIDFCDWLLDEFIQERQAKQELLKGYIRWKNYKIHNCDIDKADNELIRFIEEHKFMEDLK